MDSRKSDEPPLRPAGACLRREKQPATQAEQGTDTARYLAAGARRAILVTASTTGLPLVDIRAALGRDTNVIFESNTIINFLNPDLCLAIVGARLWTASLI